VAYRPEIYEASAAVLAEVVRSLPDTAATVLLVGNYAKAGYLNGQIEFYGAGVVVTPGALTQILPADLVKNTPKGKLVNPYKDTQADIVAQGETLFRSYGCSGCHGGSAGGGMCPPLPNDIWVYGGDDDTIFRLVTLGTVDLQNQGYSRKGRENVVGPMPPFGGIIKSADDLWKIFAFVRFHYSGDPDYKFGTPANP